MNRIRDLRTAAGWTQAQLGEKLNVGNTAISQYESETRQLDPATIHALCDLFGCTADYLLGRSDVAYSSVTPEDAALLASYHSAPENVREAISVLLSGESEPAEKKKAV